MFANDLYHSQNNVLAYGSESDTTNLQSSIFNSGLSGLG